MRRLFWFVSGAIAGASILKWVQRTMVSVSEKLTPARIADAIATGVRRGILALSDGVMSVVGAYRNREASGSMPAGSSIPTSPASSVRRHNPPRQRTSHR